ncbi:MAG: YgeY family selenium metabolism-linked hydrolase [Spirochaetae bacterium HGW-Spirochaetae-4]|jgi:putative selenium metabolism hydrolase|nr:MAG: YgeY family selenium metabolism-linked hydrolase [Spirochaetae bacterium HGW-Spirochaetae-4]
MTGVVGVNNEKLIAFCQDLIRLKSLSGNEQAVAERIIREMRELGYDEIRSDQYGNVIGKLNGDGRRSILFEGHMDIVDVPDAAAWSVDPFGAVIKDGRLYGRGAADMKAALAAMIHGAATSKGTRTGADIWVVAVVYEEVFEGVGFGKVLDHIAPDAVVLGEPNNLEIAIGQKGRAEIILETIGVNAHSAHPERGVNAIDQMVRLLHHLRKTPPAVSPQLGEGIMVATDMISSPYPGTSIIPSRCRVTLDRRLLEDEDRESVLAPIRSTIDTLESLDPSFKAEVSYAREALPTYTGESLTSERFYPGWYLDEEDFLVLAAKKVYSDMGLDPLVRTYQFCTDGSESAGNRHIPTIGIGPGKVGQAHVVDEYVEIQQILLVAEIYGRLAAEYWNPSCKGS